MLATYAQAEGFVVKSSAPPGIIMKGGTRNLLNYTASTNDIFHHEETCGETPIWKEEDDSSLS